MRKGDSKKQAILDVAHRLFYQKGYEQTSVQDILSVLNCSKGSFYHHFESKLSVLETLCVERAQKAFEGYEKDLKQGMEPLERFNLLLYHAMPLRKAEQPFLLLMLPMAATPEGTSLGLNYANALTDSFSDALDKILKEGCEDGTFFIPKREGLAGIIMLLINHLWQEAALQLRHAKTVGENIDANNLLPLLEITRYTVARLVEAPHGAIEIIRMTETLPLLESVLVRMRLEP